MSLTFDHAAAARLRAKGWSYAAIGRRFGVSAPTVRDRLDPAARARSVAVKAAWRVSACVHCGSSCSRRTLHDAGRCRACYATARAGTRPAPSVLPDGRLYCATCNQALPPFAFPFSRGKWSASRGGRHTYCRPCWSARQKARRNALRAAHSGGSTCE